MIILTGHIAKLLLLLRAGFADRRIQLPPLQVLFRIIVTTARRDDESLELFSFGPEGQSLPMIHQRSHSRPIHMPVKSVSYNVRAHWSDEHLTPKLTTDLAVFIAAFCTSTASKGTIRRA